MAIDFIPTVWASRLLTALGKSLVYGQANVCNRDYQGEIADAGSSVKIASISDIDTGTYERNTDIGEPAVLSAEDQTLSIDQSKYFHFYVDSVDRAQTNVNILDEAMRRAAWKLRDDADSYLAGLMAAGVPAGNTIGTTQAPIIPTKANAYEHLVDLGVKLDEANVPLEGRFVVVPSWFHALLLKDERFTKAGTMRSDEALRNGQIGEGAGFSILKSNNVPNSTGTLYRIIAGHSMGTSYVEQILDLHTYKPEKRFGDAVKGLHVYGAKVVRGASLACLIANKA
jgi:N4-gp56 family major capsid protein